MKTENFSPVLIDDDFDFAVQSAVRIFNENGVFVYPTDTIYGLGGNPFNKDVVQRIFGIKERPEQNKFILLVENLDKLAQYIELKSDRHFDFLFRILNKPVSVILNLNNFSKELLGYPAAAFRIPGHRFCKKLLSEIGKPLISTSVNKSGQPPLNDPEQIKYIIGDRLDAIFYTRKKASEKASTIIDVTGDKPVLIREGVVKFEEIIKKF